jgi:UDP-N-acetylmuramoylalanine--D-glutamate ligase
VERSTLAAKSVAVFGLGRSGLAVARAAIQCGAQVTVYDEGSATSLAKPDLLEEARALGAVVRLESTPADSQPDLLVTNPAVDMRHVALRAAVDAGIEVVSEVEFAFRISKAPIVAITGTNGKSTTTVMTTLCLQAAGVDAVLCGNIFGSGYPEKALTDAALDASADQILVAEVSSFQLEWVSRFRPVSAGITNITPDHQNRYDSFEQYAQTKQRIFAAQTSADFAVVRANDPVVRAPGRAGGGYRPRHLRRAESAVESDSPSVLTFGATAEHARIEERFLTVFDESILLESLPFAEPHNFQNAAMALLLAYGALAATKSSVVLEAREAKLSGARRRVYGARQEEPEHVLPLALVEGLRMFKGLAHRMELVGSRDGVRVINNSMCTNPDAVIKSAQAVRDPCHLLIGGVNKGLDFAPLRNYLANGRHHAYLFGADAANLNAMLGGVYPVFDTLIEAFDASTRYARSGEAILLAPGCASTDQFRDFRHRGDVFRERAKEWLNRAGSA